MSSQQSSNGSERRGAPRALHRVPLAILGDGTVLQAETVNLSSTGAYCTIDQFLPPMTKLQLEFELPEGSRHARVRCAGAVVRAEPVVATPEKGRYNIAIFFTDLSERDRSAISRFVAGAPRAH
jgi:hypothetical protein